MNWRLQFATEFELGVWQHLITGPAEEVWAELGRQVSGQYHSPLRIQNRDSDWTLTFGLEKDGYQAVTS